MPDDPRPEPAPAREETREGSDSILSRLLVALKLKPSLSIRDDLEGALAEADPEAGFSPQERAMLKNVLELSRARVDDVMVPRVDIVAVAADTSLGDLLRTFRTAGHSRLPVYEESLDDPRGMIHIRDFLDYLAAKAEIAVTGRPAEGAERPPPSLDRIDLSQPLSAARILRPVLFVPPSMPAVDLLVKMQATRTHMALVIDEYGGTDGLVSIEDLVEMIVGDIEDEHDERKGPNIVPEGPGVFMADGRTPIEDVTTALGTDLDLGEAAEEIDTIGGLIVTLAGRVPVRGEIIPGAGGMEFEVLDADPRRVAKLRIHLKGGNGTNPPRRQRGREVTAETSTAGPATPPAVPPPDKAG